jgi:AGCS family alanine or glycine:cation symporter
MAVMAFLGGATAFVESTLAQVYKRDVDGEFRGGIPYYIEKGLGLRWLALIAAAVAMTVYAVLAPGIQSNNIAAALDSAFDVDPAVTGAVMMVLLAFIILGGRNRIVAFAETTIPFMAAAYILAALAVLALNAAEIPGLVKLILGSACGADSVFGGIVGAAIAWGVRRAMFSNVAGVGEGTFGSGAAQVSHPAKQGLVQSLGVYFDTWLVCSVTAFIVLLYGTEFDTELAPIAVTQMALQGSLGTWAIHALTVILFLLAWTSVLGNYYYGESNLQFLDATHQHMTYFRGAVLAAVFLGSVAPLTVVWSFADVSMGVMAAVNLVAIAPLSTIAFRLLADYTRQLRNGLDPQFTLAKMPDLKNVHCWGEATGPLPDAVDRSEGLAAGDPAPQEDPVVDGGEGMHDADWDPTATGASGDEGGEGPAPEHGRGPGRDD